MKPLISIIIPIYNTEKYLAETIASVIAQDYANWELLLIDDGSTDDSVNICKKHTLTDQRISYHYKTNGGQASARNLGIKKSSGEWLTFLDADDLWLPTRLSDQLEEATKFNADFLYGMGYYYQPETATPLQPFNWITGEMKSTDFFQILYHSSLVTTHSVMFRKSLIANVGYFNESDLMRGTEDWDLWLRITKQVDKIYGSPKRNVYYRIHDGGIHFQHTRMLFGKAEIYKQYDNDPSIGRLRRLRQYRFVYRELMNHLFTENRLEELKTVMAELAAKDPYGFVTLKQRVLIKILPVKSFMWWSQKILYRIGYRLENITYKVAGHA